MPVVDGRDQKRGIGFSEQDDLLVRMKIKHDYPACALFRGGKCSCDESDNLCPKCGTEEWDRITDRTAPGAAFNRCNRCDNEWTPAAPCSCGNPDANGIVHRADGPCFYDDTFVDLPAEPNCKGGVSCA